MRVTLPSITSLSLSSYCRWWMFQVLCLGSLGLRDCGFIIRNLELCSVLNMIYPKNKNKKNRKHLFPHSSSKSTSFRKIPAFIHFPCHQTIFYMGYFFFLQGKYGFFIILFVFSSWSTEIFSMHVAILGFKWLPLLWAPRIPPKDVCFSTNNTRLQPNMFVCLLLSYPTMLTLCILCGA